MNVPSEPFPAVTQSRPVNWEEPEKIKKWWEEQQKMLEVKDPIYMVIMRNSLGKLFIYVAVLGVLCFFVFLLSSTHTSLSSAHTSLKELEKCQLQRDSFSAQLRVVYDHKSRLEKSLQQEKTDHRHTKEVTGKQVHELETKLWEEKDKGKKLETQVTQLKTSYTELEEDKVQSEAVLKEQMKAVQAQKNTEIEKLQNRISELLAEKDKLEMSNNAFALKIEQHAYALPDVKQQIEVPVFSSKFNGRHKNFGLPPQHSNNDIAAAQMQDMMNKSPGNINKLDEQNVLHMPFQDDGLINKKISKLEEEELDQRRIEDKNYEEDDDVRENDDEPANDMQHVIKGMNILQDNDFDDQENQDNVDNAKEEKGAVVTPK